MLTSSYLGTSIEYYDFLIYGTSAALVFNHVFFANLPAFAASLVSLATLAAGYVVRPLGGVIFGHFGDRVGRKSMLVLSMSMMGAASMMIGLVPGRDQIGVAAPILLVVLRLVQGIAVGGEWGGASLMAVEHAGHGRRGIAAAVANAGGPTGAVLAALVLGLSSLMPHEAFLAWGWRVPFLFSGVLLAIGLWVRLRVAESPVFLAALRQRQAGGRAKPPILTVLRRPGLLLTAGGSVLAAMVYQSLLATTVLQLAVADGIEQSTVLLLQALASLVNIGSVVGFGALSDRIGRRPVLIAGALAGGVLIYPVLLLATSGSAALVLVGFLLGYGLVVGSLFGAASSFVTEQFGTEHRYTGASLGYQLSATLGAGFTPMVAGALLGGGTAPIAWFVGGVCLLSLIAVVRASESYRAPIAADDHTHHVTVTVTETGGATP
ncbi:MFS transporter [Amycolatopsis endophytica]|uniref:MFS family permease n=1 Tax=Amycolatopsis endophytica TaxID=860233 RepID=A0A853BD62_9PSEU|nr:MFS transporter [Amycolatopsis endophytica]NYI92366.1 MFS family permease [Amycolatopsis endophytica]